MKAPITHPCITTVDFGFIMYKTTSINADQITHPITPPNTSKAPQAIEATLFSNILQAIEGIKITPFPLPEGNNRIFRTLINNELYFIRPFDPLTKEFGSSGVEITKPIPGCTEK